MTLRKITVDNSVRYIPKNEQTIESEPIMKKNKKQSKQNQPISGGGNSNKKPSKNNKRFLKNFQHQDLLHSQTNIHVNIHIWICVIM